ncbi:hypothetical protein PPERSA_09235 [Pseudocohnilembus persalinus]|uniref:Uncharacterized protein n=1 Tax=Pseudocohnilembus persalinus TaxID=266149 RepID=A0A0V0QM52_PSEPJ|nr:hypothetical protein PPERSA_09235 [Pseudocohnilembus persalinus]|eukprot:KRX03223.1 hypothetical protein PPERSA_09235 [Pseudocohnilembus persalinus]
MSGLQTKEFQRQEQRIYHQNNPQKLPVINPVFLTNCLCVKNQESRRIELYYLLSLIANNELKQCPLCFQNIQINHTGEIKYDFNYAMLFSEYFFTYKQLYNFSNQNISFPLQNYKMSMLSKILKDIGQIVSLYKKNEQYIQSQIDFNQRAICPFSKKRLYIPVKLNSCKNHQYYDLVYILDALTNQKIQHIICKDCNYNSGCIQAFNKEDLKNLFIDENYMNALKQYPIYQTNIQEKEYTFIYKNEFNLNESMIYSINQNCQQIYDNSLNENTDQNFIDQNNQQNQKVKEINIFFLSEKKQKFPIQTPVRCKNCFKNNQMQCQDLMYIVSLIIYPVRGINCNHATCYDLETLIEKNIQKCFEDNCNEQLTINDIRIDELIQNLLTINADKNEEFYYDLQNNEKIFMEPQQTPRNSINFNNNLVSSLNFANQNNNGSQILDKNQPIQNYAKSLIVQRGGQSSPKNNRQQIFKMNQRGKSNQKKNDDMKNSRETNKLNQQLNQIKINGTLNENQRQNQNGNYRLYSSQINQNNQNQNYNQPSQPNPKTQNYMNQNSQDIYGFQPQQNQKGVNSPQRTSQKYQQNHDYLQNYQNQKSQNILRQLSQTTPLNDQQLKLKQLQAQQYQDKESELIKKQQLQRQQQEEFERNQKIKEKEVLQIVSDCIKEQLKNFSIEKHAEIKRKIIQQLEQNIN